MDYIACNALDHSMIRQLETLNILTDYEPFYAASVTGTFRHFFLCLSHGRILSFLSLLPLSDTSVEITGYTHPGHRHKGYFSQLLQNALWELSLSPIRDILSDRPLNFPFVLSTPAYSEYLMSLSPEDYFSPVDSCTKASAGTSSSCTTEITEYCIPNQDCTEYIYVLHVSSIPAGLLKISHDANSPCACLHHVQIRKSMRSHGYGKRLLNGALKMFFEENTCNILLHVTSNNTPAVKLYTNTGFQIIQSLDYFHLHPAEQSHQ